MPIPNKSVGDAISFLKKEKPKMKRSQAIAIALDIVRRKKAGSKKG
jgi:hypothetical protein